MFRRFLLLTLVLLAVPSAIAQAQPKTEAQQATEALEVAKDLANGRGVRSGRELSPALQRLAVQRSKLNASEREQADELLARPTDPLDTGQPGGPYSPSATVKVDCSDAHFCVHWVETTPDKVPAGDSSPANNVPDYVDHVIASFQSSYATENSSLGWIAAKSDGTLGGNAKTDVYLKDIGDDGIYGYASTDPGQSGRSRYAFLVLDNDYAASQFPDYSDPLAPMQVTAAHEYNHVLQYAYDAFQDTWMFEATATWAEEKVFDSVNDYVFYLGSWAARPDVPLTSAGDGIAPSSDDLKMYGSAIWNHWLDAAYGAAVIRNAWSSSIATGIGSHGFAPRAYDTVIRNAGGPGFAGEYADFAAATAEWDAANSGIREGSTFPSEVARRGTLVADDTPATGSIDHTAFALYDVPIPSGASNLNLTGGLPAGTGGAIALIGFDGTNQDRIVKLLDAHGRVTVSLADPERFTRITAAVISTDTQNTGQRLGDEWLWTKDDQPFSLQATTGDVPVEPTPTPTATPSPTPTPTAEPTVTPPPPPPPPVATSVRLSRSSTKLSSVLRKGVLSVFAQTNKAGRHSAKATVDARTAKRLKVGRRTTAAGTGQRIAIAPARLKINVKLTRKLRNALKRERRRAVKLKVAVTFTPTDGTHAVRRTITITFRP